MNDFGRNLSQCVGVVKAKHFTLPANPTTRDRSFNIESGPGCSPERGTQRKVKGHWAKDRMLDTINSYDFEYVVSPEGEKLLPDLGDIVEVETVKLANETPIEPAKPVRRKR